MSRFDKLVYSFLCGRQDANIRFSDARNLMLALGFRERIRGDHYIYTKEGVAEKINIQPLNNMAKPYQVKQIRNLIIKYQLGDEDNV